MKPPPASQRSAGKIIIPSLQFSQVSGWGALPSLKSLVTSWLVALDKQQIIWSNDGSGTVRV
ncbi:hypothetical protein [Microcoleus sp. herbarium12]|uniref:hypothetical protein n=1 Tax=Microcoleus sp. herbarium12 TaxID=3055437 RepID=UPI002FD1932D